MKVSACSGLSYDASPKINHSKAIRQTQSKYKYSNKEPLYETDYNGLKRVTFIVGMTSLALMSFVLAAAGKACKNI